MTDLPSSVGYITVTGRLILGIADSDDENTRPDATAASANITITNNAPAPLVAFGNDGSGTLVSLETINATLDADGYLVAPLDGRSGKAGTERNIRLAAPNQASLSSVGWTWTFLFKSTSNPPRFKEFAIPVTGQPGETIDLSDAAIAKYQSSLVAQPTTWIQEGTVLPANIRQGQFLLDTLTNTLYLYQ